MLLGDVATGKDEDERDDGDCVPPLRKFIFCPVNFANDNGCESCNGDYAHAHWLCLDIKFHSKEKYGLWGPVILINMLRQLSNNSNQIAKLTLKFDILKKNVSQTLSTLPWAKLDGEFALKKTGLLRDAMEIEHPTKWLSSLRAQNNWVQAHGY
jgi:hypothetical protein